MSNIASLREPLRLSGQQVRKAVMVTQCNGLVGKGTGRTKVDLSWWDKPVIRVIQRAEAGRLKV